MKVEGLRQLDYYGVEKGIAEAYIDTLQAHIHYVQEAGRKLGVSEDQLVIHDDSKWTKAEFPGYAMHFQGGGAPDLFSYAWLHHIHYNPHHWQSWIFPDEFTPKDSVVENGIIQMPNIYVLEMVADWMGASRAYTESWDMGEWLSSNIPRIKVHSRTAKLLRDILGDLGYAEVVRVQKFANEI